MRHLLSTIMLACLAIGANAQESFYPEGDAAMQEFFRNNIVYPKVALENSVHGVVYVRMTIDKKGKGRDIKVTSKSKYPQLDREAERVVGLVKSWVPQKDSKQVVIPVEFHLPSGHLNSASTEGNSFEYPEGEEAWAEFVSKNFRYPKSLGNERVSGTLYVDFMISAKGKGSNYSISTPSGYPEIDAEAVRVVSRVKRWNPAVSNGRPYKTLHSIRVDFKAPETANGQTIIEERHVQTNPSYPGGDQAMVNFINKNMKYPKNELRKKIEGYVEVEFIVMEDGSLSDLKVVRSVSEGLDAEALRIVGMMPKWSPAIATDGSTVTCSMIIPVNFRLPRSTK